MDKIIYPPAQFIIEQEGGKSRKIRNLWQGNIHLPAGFILEQIEVIEEAMEKTRNVTREAIEEKKGLMYTVTDKLKLFPIVLCVKEWQLEGFPKDVTVDNFPLSPRQTSHEFIRWLWNEVLAIYFGEIEIPNE